MQKFIGVKLTEAKPMTRGRYNEYRGWVIPADENPLDAGCLVKHASGYESWCPLDEFVKQNTLVRGDKNTITQKDVDNFIGSMIVNTIKMGGVAKSTLVSATLVNGFVMHETSSCVDPANYDEQVGADICVEKIKEKVKYLLGFLLQCSLNGFQGVK